MDFFFPGSPRVLRIRLLRPSPQRRFAPRAELKSARIARHDKALDLLERRRQAWLAGENDLGRIEKEIRALGCEFEDEPDADDGRYSYWMTR